MASRTLKGIALVVVSMATFAVADMFIKLATQRLPPPQVLAMMGLGGGLLFWLLAARARVQVLAPIALHRTVLARTGIEILATGCMFSALATAPLTLVSAITQAVPLVVTLAAVLVLGERVGPRRWAAVLAGLAGVLLMLRPDTSGVSFGALMALGATLGLGLRDVVTRMTPAGAHNLQLSTYGFTVLAPIGAVWMALSGHAWQPVDLAGGLFVGGALAGAAAGYYAITAAMRTGDVSVTAPFRYTRLLFAGALGIAVFGERPDALTWTGAALVIASGLYVLWREGRVARSALPPGRAAR